MAGFSVQQDGFLSRTDRKRMLHGIGHFSNNFQTTLPTSNMFSKSMTVLLAAVAVTGTSKSFPFCFLCH